MNILQDAARVLDEQGWIRGDFVDDAGQHCSVGALSSSADIYGAERYDRATAILAEVIEENYKPELEEEFYMVPCLNPMDLIMTWNDNVAKTKQEVIAMFEKAAVRLDEADG